MAEKKTVMVRCIACKHGEYMQWFSNPVICRCKLYEEKFVAESRRICEDYQERVGKAEITHYDHY